MKQVALTPIEIAYTQKALQFLKNEILYGYDSESIKHQESELEVINQILNKIN